MHILQERIANQIYEMCRSGRLQIPAFPDYSHLVHALSNLEPEAHQDNFEVTVKKHDKLLILQSLAAKWLDHVDFNAQTHQLIESHNTHYNQDGDFWHADQETGRRDLQPRNFDTTRKLLRLSNLTSFFCIFHVPLSSPPLPGLVEKTSVLSKGSSSPWTSWLQSRT